MLRDIFNNFLSLALSSFPPPNPLSDDQGICQGKVGVHFLCPREKNILLEHIFVFTKMIISSFPSYVDPALIEGNWFITKGI